MIQIQDILRAGHVPRWQLCDTTRTQTIAEHMFNTAFIARHMCVCLGIGDDYQNRVVMSALRHDLDEVITGDMPTVTKNRLRDKGVEPNGLVDTTDVVMPDDFTRQIVKTADLIESTWWINEHGVGRHAKKVSNLMLERLRDHFIDTDVMEQIRDAGMHVWEQIELGEILI